MSRSPLKTSRRYFDHNATSPLAVTVPRAITEALERGGNPSSLHAEGRASLALLDDCRAVVADAIGGFAHDLVFTSGGTEANHLGLVGLSRTSKRLRPAVPQTVHPSLAAAARSVDDDMPLVALSETGCIDLAGLGPLLSGGNISVLGVSAANHEIGVLEDLSAISQICREHGALLFCDAVQALGRVDVKEIASMVDGLSLSAHKIGGPKGVGAVWLRPGPALEALIGGGKQESGRRPGTQAVCLIAGFAAACRLLDARLADVKRQTGLRDRLESSLVDLGAILHSGGPRLCNTISLRFPGVTGELLVAALDLQGFAVSTGAACSSGSSAASPVLLAIGLSKAEALQGVRLSIGPETRSEDVDALIAVLPEILARARRFG